MSERSQQMQEFILSRTSEDLALNAAARDDNDVLPIFFLAENGTEESGAAEAFHFGDRRIHDHH